MGLLCYVKKNQGLYHCSSQSPHVAFISHETVEMCCVTIETCNTERVPLQVVSLEIGTN